MRTLFSDDSFGGRGFAPFRMAQAETAYPIFEDIFGLIGVSEDDIDALFDKVPPEKLGAYRDRYRECREMRPTSTESISCLHKLYKDMKEASETAEKARAALPTPRPSGADFPILPVGIGVLAATGLVVFLATR
jgi:hypothetical protein